MKTGRTGDSVVVRNSLIGGASDITGGHVHGLTAEAATAAAAAV